MSQKDQMMPDFMKNQEWYYYDEKLEMYNLTDKAPNIAIKSYNEYYSEEIEEGIIKKKETKIKTPREMVVNMMIQKKREKWKQSNILAQKQLDEMRKKYLKNNS